MRLSICRVSPILFFPSNETFTGDFHTFTATHQSLSCETFTEHFHAPPPLWGRVSVTVSPETFTGGRLPHPHLPNITAPWRAKGFRIEPLRAMQSDAISNPLCLE